MKKWVYDKTLLWVNSLRFKSLEKLPRGLMRDDKECPITRALESTDWIENHPWYVKVFVHWHDQGKYPTLYTARPLYRGQRALVYDHEYPFPA